MSIQTNYSFRNTTIESFQLSTRAPSSSHHTSRTILPLEATASRIKEKDHDCIQFDVDGAIDKSQRRIFGHFIKAVIANVFQCKVGRSSTHLQGAKSTCENCESSHWSLTPGWQDEKLAKVIEEILKKGPHSPSRRKQLYLTNTANFTEDDFKFLDTIHTQEDKVRLFIRQKINPKYYENSFANTDFEAQSNSTIENHSFSNDYDSYIEKLRKKEDDYIHRVSSAELTPVQSTLAIVQDLEDAYVVSLQNIALRKEQIHDFFETEKTIDAFETKYLDKDTIEEVEFIGYVNAIKKFLDLKKELTQSLKGAPRYHAAKTKHRLDHYWLQSIVKSTDQIIENGYPISDAIDYFNLTKTNLKKASPKPTIQEALSKYEILSQEAVAQYQGLLAIDREKIDNLYRLFFGVCIDGVNRTPNRQELEQQVYAMTKKKISSSQKQEPLLPSNITNLPLPKSPNTKLVSSPGKENQSSESNKKRAIDFSLTSDGPPLKKFKSKKQLFKD